MTALRNDRMISLEDLSAYPGSDYLDLTIYLPWSKDIRRRVWLLIPESSPTIGVDDATLEPQSVSSQQPRWIDYGFAELPIITEPNFALGEFYQLRVWGMEVSECAASHLVITANQHLSLEGCSVEEAERRLWGLARCDAGRTTLHPSRLRAGFGADFTVRYTAGPTGLPAGALIRFSVPGAFSRPQAEAPDAPGFVSVVEADCEMPDVRIEMSTESHGNMDIICRLQSELMPTKGLTLRYNTERTYIFASDAFHETERRTWYSHLPPLSAAVALSEAAHFVNLAEENGHSLETVPGPSERLHLFLPGRRFSEEALSLRGTFTDRYRNVPPAGPIDAGLDLWLEGGEERIPLGTAAGHLVARHRFEIPLPQLAPGVYRAAAYRSSTHDELARSNPMEIVDEERGLDRIFWGEIHGHTEMSDGSGDFWELYRHAQNEGCLEFAAASDHAEYFSDNQWLWMQDVTNGWNQPGRFITLVGYETEGKQRDRCVYTSRSRLKLFRGNYPPTNGLDVVWGHFHGDEQVVGGPHATVVHSPTWEHHDPTVERFAEVYSMWGASDTRDNPLAPRWIEEGRGVTVNGILKTGAKLGFTGGGDCHEGHCGFAAEDADRQGITPHTFSSIIMFRFRCGMTAAMMPSLDRASLLRSLRNRRTYATTGARILLNFTAAGLPMGAIGTAQAIECRATVHAVQPVRTIRIVKDGEEVWSRQSDQLDVSIRWQDPIRPADEHYYYLHIVQDDGHMAWSSPIWVRSGAD